MLTESLWKISWSRGRLQVLPPWQLFPAWHCLFRRRSYQIKYDDKLMRVAFSRQDGLAIKHLSENAAILKLESKELPSIE